MGRLDAGLCFVQRNAAKNAWKQAKKGQPGRFLGWRQGGEV
jgi:hypothetical protein